MWLKCPHCVFLLYRDRSHGQEDPKLLRLGAPPGALLRTFMQCFSSEWHSCSTRVLFFSFVGEKTQVERCSVASQAVVTNEECVHWRMEHRECSIDVKAQLTKVSFLWVLPKSRLSWAEGETTLSRFSAWETPVDLHYSSVIPAMWRSLYTKGQGESAAGRKSSIPGKKEGQKDSSPSDWKELLADTVGSWWGRGPEVPTAMGISFQETSPMATRWGCVCTAPHSLLLFSSIFLPGSLSSTDIHISSPLWSA